MKIKVCIIHCDPNIMVDIYFVLNKFNTQVLLFKSYDYELDCFLRNRDIDIAIIDADYTRNSYDGIFISQRIKIFNRKTLIIFTSNNCDLPLLMKIINAEPFAFVLHNQIRNELPDILEKSIRIIQKGNGVFYYHKQNENISVSLRNVLYFTSLHRVIKYYCIDEHTDVFYEKMDNLETTICDVTDSFVRIGQSYLINMNYIISFDNNSVTMINGDVLMISRKYHENLAVIKQYKRAGD